MRKLAVSMVVAIGLALTAWQVGRAHESLGSFLIVVERTDKGVDLKCVRGCTWKHSYDCATVADSKPIIVIDGVQGDVRTSCRFGISERGVGPAPEDP